MNVILVVGVLGVMALAVASFFIWDKWREYRIGNFEFVKKTFLTPNEVDFYKRLLKACAGDYTVMAQVSMGALIDTALNPNHELYWEVRSHFSGRICDFVLCSPSTLAPMLVIELDDVMHDFKLDERRDTFVSQVGLRTLRFWSKKKPTVSELRAKILKTLGVAGA